MPQILPQLPTFVRRTYRGGALLRAFLGQADPQDDFCPEDWISSFVEAKNQPPLALEGISRVQLGKQVLPITQAVSSPQFGQGRNTSGVLIKLLDSAERLGIQVHPTREFAERVFHTPFGKTECWHILATRTVQGQAPCVYLGFQPHVTRALWQSLYAQQDIPAMLRCLHRFEVQPGDTVLVCGGMPHAIGAGCFLLEIQEPSDYTMRVEKVTAAGEVLSAQQLHYGAGEENLLDCFDYTPLTRAQIHSRFFLSSRNRGDTLVSYADTPCFALERTTAQPRTVCKPYCLTVVFTQDNGLLCTQDAHYPARRGDRFFVPANLSFTLSGAAALLCHPPQQEDTSR